MKATDQRKHTQIALQTIPVDLYAKQKKLQVNLLMDPGATGTFMSKRAAEQLNLTGYAVRTTITGFGGAKTEEDAVVAKLQIAAQGEKKKHWIQVQIMENPAASYQPFNWRKHQHRFEHLKNLPLKEPAPGPVEIMIGLEAPHLVSSLIQDIGGHDKASPVARFTRLGWVVGGPTGVPIMGGDDRSAFAFFSKRGWKIPNSMAAGRWESFQFASRDCKEGVSNPTPEPEDARLKAGVKERDEMLHTQVARMWEVDAAIGKHRGWEEDEAVFDQLKEKISMEDGKYILPTLWKRDQPRIGNNYKLALDRLKALLGGRKLTDPEIKKQYHQQLQELEKKGYVEEVDTDTPGEDKANYLPHFPVIRWDKSSTQVRLIMDAAAKYGKQLCLNDCLLKGPKLINELIAVLMRFRLHNITFAADVKKMFFQIKMRKEDRDYHRYLWVREDEPEKVRIYRWKVHPFGSAASPCIAMFAIKHHAGVWKDVFPRAAETVIHSTLVDDNMDSVATVEEAKELGTQLVQLYDKAGMQLSKVVSNSPEVLGMFPADMVAPSLQVAELCTQDLQLPLVKALGVIYISDTDEFSYNMETPAETENWTKRKILRHEARLYDPHGLISPHSIKARIILQRLWRAGVGWDDAVPEEVREDWMKWLKASESLPHIRIPRCLHNTANDEKGLSYQIHIFCDASGEAYAAAAYYRSTDEQGKHQVRLMMSKGKVAPLHLTSIPRMELMSAELALELKYAITSILGTEEEKFQYWTDSTNVLCWIRADSRVLNTFVGTRVAKIQQNTDVERWRWVSTGNNPADIPSRGVTAEKLKGNHKWLQGPDFLKQSQDKWPKMEEGKTQGEEAMKEVKKGVAFTLTSREAKLVRKDVYSREHPGNNTALLNISNWGKLVRVVAWCRRFRTKKKGPIEAGEIKKAEKALIRMMQAATLQQTIFDLTTIARASNKSSIEAMMPFLDQDGLVRAGSRLQRAEHLPYDSRFPIIIPKDHPFTELLIEATHKRLLHAGSQHTTAELQQQFKIVRGNNLVRKVVRSCIICRRKRAKPTEQMMAPLPDFRFPQHRTDPYASTALDAAGPFFVREKKGGDTRKVYFVLFTCLVYRAVHLEPLFTMTAASFLQALDRFCARRGVPSRIVSDNGTNFTAAAAEVTGLWKKEARQLYQEKRPQINWEFLPPYAPHFGGVHERMIGATKSAMYHVFRPSTAITVENFLTALAVVEGILNSRPLTYVTADDDALTPLTPADFLNTKPYRATAVLPKGADRQSAWRQLQDRLDQLWRRFIKEMQPHLHRTSKRRLRGRNLQPGDVVVFLEKDNRGVWPLGRILAVRESADGVVRRIKVLSAGTAHERAVERVMLLLPVTKGAEEAGQETGDAQ